MTSPASLFPAKAAFLGKKPMGDDFLTKVLDCMFFNTFVAERGPPWRHCDIWDDLYATIGDHLRQEEQDLRLLLVHIQVSAREGPLGVADRP